MSNGSSARKKCVRRAPFTYTTTRSSHAHREPNVQLLEPNGDWPEDITAHEAEKGDVPYAHYDPAGERTTSA